MLCGGRTPGDRDHGGPDLAGLGQQLLGERGGSGVGDLGQHPDVVERHQTTFSSCRKASTRSAPSPSSTTISPPPRSSTLETSVISCPAPAEPTWSAPTPRSDDGEHVDGLGLGRHDPLEGGVPGLDDAGGHADHGGQRALDLVVAGLGLALDLHGATVDRDLLGERDGGETQQLGHLGRDGPGVAVGRLGGGQHEVGLGPLDGGRQHLGRAERVGAGQGVVGDQDGLGGAHRQRGAQTRGLPTRRHRDEDHLVPLPAGQLQAHLHAIGVGVIQDQLARAVEGVGGGIKRRGRGRIRDLFDADDDVHDRSLFITRCAGRHSPQGRISASRRATMASAALRRSVMRVSTPASSIASRS